MQHDQIAGRRLYDQRRDQNGAAPGGTQLSTAELVAASDHGKGHDRLEDASARAADDGESLVHLFQPEEVEWFRVEWQQVQTGFVDDPKDAVQGADRLVAEVLRSLASTFSDRKHELEGQWQGDSDALTEDLRLALRRYRSFFNQLLDA
jgi:hypothetical protein